MNLKMNPFDRFVSKNFMFGMKVNCVDEPGGESDGGGAGGEGNSDDLSGGNANDDAGDDDAGDSAGDDSSGDDGDSDSGDGSDPDYKSRFDNLDTKVSTLLDKLGSDNNNSNSDNDGKDDSDPGTFDLESDDLVAMLADDPAGFIGKLTASIEQKVTERVSTDNANNEYNGKVEKTIDTYAEANPDFEAKWDDGSIKEFMGKNPGHNAISAHMQMSMEQRLADAKKEGADEAVKNFRSKAGNQVLNGNQGILPEQRDAALKNPGKFGGRAAVLAARAGITG